MNRPGHTWIIAVLTALGLSSSPVHAWEYLTLHPTRGEIIARFEGTNRRDASGEDLSDIGWKAGVRISQEGYSIDPDIANYLLQVEPLYAPSTVHFGELKEERESNLLNYSFEANFLKGTPGPVGFDLSLMQSSDLNTGSLGSLYDNEIQQHKIGFNWKNTAFPLRMVFEQRSLKQEFRSGLNKSISERNEDIQTWTVKGGSSKLKVLIQHLALEDRAADRVGRDYNENRANLTHRLQWGHGSQLESRWDFYDRKGFNTNRRITIDETAQVHHTDQVFSRTSYRYYEVTQDLKTTEHTGRFELNHQLYDNLTTKGELYALSRRSEDQLDEFQWNTGFDTQYQKSDLLFGGGVNASLGFAYQLTDRDSKLGLVEVLDEQHVIVFSGDLILRRRFVLSSTIIVTDRSGQLVYSQGFDYDVLELAEDLTQLQVIPGGRIESEQTILVTYKAHALPSMEYSTTFTRYSLGINFGWLRISHHHNQSVNKLRSGLGESFLTDRRDTVTDIHLRWKIKNIEAALSAERRISEIGDFKSTIYLYQQSLNWALSSRALVTLNVVESFTETETRNTDLHNIELSLNWRPLYNLSIRPVIGAWRRVDAGSAVNNGQREDEFITAGVSANWFYRKVAMEFSYVHNQRTTDLIPTTEDRVLFNLTRRF